VSGDAGAAVPTVDVLGVPIAALDRGQVVEQVGAWVAAGERRYVCVCPAHSLTDGVWSPEHRAALRGADLNTADGVPVVWALRLLGHPAASRVYGPDLMLDLLAAAERAGWRVAFYGGRPERLAPLLEAAARRFPGLTVAFAESPPFRPLRPAEDAALVERLGRARPDLVWVGLGAPKQERWMARHVGRVPGVLLGVGAAFDQLAGAAPRAPKPLQNMGLEWAFRLLREPRRLGWRYARANPTYAALVGAQVVSRLLRGAPLRPRVHDRSDPATLGVSSPAPRSVERS